MSTRKKIFFTAFLALLALVVYRRILGYPLLCDDYYLLGFERDQSFGLPDQWLGPLSTGKWLLQALYPVFLRPLPLLVWLVDYRLFGDSGLVPHLLTAALLFGSAALTFFLLSGFGLRPLTAGWISVLIIVNPVSAATVAWASDSFDLFALFFILLTLICYQSFLRRGSRLAYAGACLAFAAALLSKESAVILIVLLPLMDLLLGSFLHRTGEVTGGGRLWQRIRRMAARLAPFLAMTVSYAVLRFIVLGNLALGGQELLNNDCAWCRFPNSLLTLLSPLDDQLFRRRYVLAVAALIGLMALSSLLLVIFRWRKTDPVTRRTMLFLAAFFVVSLSPLQLYYYFYELRMLFVTNVAFYVIVIAGLLEFGWRDIRWRAGVSVFLTLIVALNLFVLSRNSTAWESAAALNEDIPAQMQSLLPDPPAGSRIYVDLSDSGIHPLVECKPFFRCIIKEKYQRHDLTVLPAEEWQGDGYLFRFSAAQGKLSLVEGAPVGRGD